MTKEDRKRREREGKGWEQRKGKEGGGGGERRGGAGGEQGTGGNTGKGEGKKKGRGERASTKGGGEGGTVWWHNNKKRKEGGGGDDIKGRRKQGGGLGGWRVTRAHKRGGGGLGGGGGEKSNNQSTVQGWVFGTPTLPLSVFCSPPFVFRGDGWARNARTGGCADRRDDEPGGGHGCVGRRRHNLNQAGRKRPPHQSGRFAGVSGGCAARAAGSGAFTITMARAEQSVVAMLCLSALTTAKCARRPRAERCLQMRTRVRDGVIPRTRRQHGTEKLESNLRI